MWWVAVGGGDGVDGDGGGNVAWQKVWGDVVEMKVVEVGRAGRRGLRERLYKV